MSSIVRGQANLHDSIESNSSNSSNKRKRVNIKQHPIFNNLYLNMHPPQAAQELTADHHLQKQEKVEDQEAAALLHHMHLMHHDDHPHVSEADHMHVDYHENGIAAGDHHVADHEMLQHNAHRQIARENSGSSDASATNYFSGDSDLTAEPIMGCAADEDGAKSSNSGSSTPFKLPRCASLSNDQAQALGAGLGQEYPINLSPQHVESTRNDKEEAAHMSPTAMVPSTSATSTAMWNCKTFSDSKLLASSQMMHMDAARKMISGCHSLQAEGADAGRGSESWLELRLGFSTELQHKLTQNLDANITARDGRKKSREESTPVTLQLLPDNSKVTETSTGAAEAMRTSTVSGSGLYGNLPPVYHPTAATFSHMRPKFDEENHTTARVVPPDHQQILLNQIRDPAAAAVQPSNLQRFPLNQSNDPAANLHQSNQRSALAGYDTGILYDQVHGYVDSNDQRRWLASETSDMMMMAAPSMCAAARPTEIYRPTASLGWPTSNAAETRSWSANSYTPPVQLQRTMSWQGLLRSMTTDPLLHPLPDLPMCSFDAGTELSGPRGRRHMLPAATAGRPPSSTPANRQRLRLATSRRSAGLWFSLQEAHQFSNEHGEDHEEQHSMQKVYLRIRDGKMQISVLKSYLMRKLESSGSPHYNSDEVEITCRGKTLAPTLTIQHVRDTIWLSKDFELNEVIGFRYTNSYLNDSHNRVMALCYQRHHTQTVTLNLLKS